MIFRSMTSDANPVAEMAWAGYLTFLFKRGELPADPEEIRALKADFLSGFEDE
jgi:hypothetical protein